jgi:hypothetical protein
MAGRPMQLWRRFRALEPGDRRLLLEAVILIGIVQAGFRILPFATLLRVLSAAKRLRHRSHHRQPRIGWAVAAAAKLVPGRTCLSDALAADVMLCRRGCQSSLRLGVKKRNGSAEPPQAHAWVESDGTIVAGELATLSEYRTLPHRGRCDAG